MTDDGQERAQNHVSSGRAMLRDFEDGTVEEQYGQIKHAIEELENARRALPDDY